MSVRLPSLKTITDAERVDGISWISRDEDGHDSIRIHGSVHTECVVLRYVVLAYSQMGSYQYI